MQVWSCSRARGIFGTRGASPKKTTCSFSYRFRRTSRNRALYQAIRVASIVGISSSLVSGPSHRVNTKKFSPTTVAGQNSYKKIISNIIFRGNCVCSYKKNTLHLARKRSAKITRVIVSGNYPVIISARMVVRKHVFLTN